MQQTFFRDNFFVLLMAGLFVFTFLFWFFNTNPEMSGPLKDINQGVFYGLLALIGVRPRVVPATQTIQAESISADNIEKASTETGDIVSPKAAADGTGKENKSDEKPIGE